MRALSEVLQAPDPVHVDKLFSRLPAIFNVVIFSPHGYFGQADVLGLPDTGGQVRCFELALEKLVCLIATIDTHYQAGCHFPLFFTLFF